MGYVRKIAQPQLHYKDKRTREEIIRKTFWTLDVIDQGDLKEAKFINNKPIGIFYSSFTILRLHYGGTKS
jgi:hypothetical protein